jgi:heme-degrading monooxygenase HmoA
MYRYIWKIKLSDPSDKDRFIAHWREGSAILQKFEGALGTHLHEVRDEPGSYYAVAEWETREARDAMSEEANHGTSELAIEWQKLPKNEEFGEVINFQGDEIGVVMPE